MWLCMPIILVLGRLRQKDYCEFEASLVDTASTRSDRAKSHGLVLEKQSPSLSPSLSNWYSSSSSELKVHYLKEKKAKLNDIPEIY